MIETKSQKCNPEFEKNVQFIQSIFYCPRFQISACTWETLLFLSPRCHVFLLLPSVMSTGFPRLAGRWALRHWLKHPRNLTSKCVTGCQCLYTWRRLVERIRITGRRVIH